MGKVFKKLQQRASERQFGVGLHSMVLITVSMLGEAFKLLSELGACAEGVDTTHFEEERKNWEDGASRFLQGGRR